MTMTFKTHYNATPTHGEVNTQPSKTIPDQTMSIAELMRRFASGLPIEGQKIPIYDGDEDVPDLARLDLSERHDLLRTVKQDINHLLNQMQNENAQNFQTTQTTEPLQ